MSVLKIPEILLPAKSVDKTKWAVIACDQFTSQPKYWEELEKTCGNVSTLKITYPEIYLGDNEDERIKNINSTMLEYLSRGVFESVNGLILTVRTTAFGHKRVGIIGAIDLEEYSVDEKRAVRPTEAIVKERLPIRIKIRKDAPLELPHALLLLDDEKKSVIEPVYERRDKLKKLYSFELNMGGGHLEGYLIDDPESVIKLIDELTSPKALKEKYGSSEPFAFAVGDGNHSIATAKACWEDLKKTLPESEREYHPSRYCLAEINNIYDEDLIFEPIYRVIFNAGKELIEKMRISLRGDSEIKVFFGGETFAVKVSENTAQAIKDVQAVIDGYISENPKVYQDYIHGEDNLLSVAKEKNGIAVFMPKLKKSDLFSYVATNGVLTRKSFSMGEAQEKRYYFEARKIK